MSSGSAMAKALSDIPSVQIFTASFRGSTDDGKALIDAGDGPIPVVNTGQYFPLIDDTVRILRINDQMILLGLSVPKSPVGTVTAVNVDPVDGATLLDVHTNDGIDHVGLRVYDSVIDPAIDDVVSINWPVGGIVEGRFLAAAPTPLPPDPGGGGTSGSAEFRANDSGSWRSGNGWWQNDVWYSDTNTGAWFYGSKVHDTIPSGATVTRIQIYLPRFSAYGGNSTFGTHGSSSKPGGNVSVSNTIDIAGTGWQDVDTSVLGAWATALKASGGVGTALTGHGFNKYSGVNSDALSGALRIDWRS